MTNIRLFRKRLFPNECIELKDDTILSHDDNVLITSWKCLKPRKDFHHGYSCYFLNEGFKISKFLCEDNTLHYWYCDIIDSEYQEEEHSLIVTDLLADVIIYPDGFVKVIDLDELVDCYERKELSLEQLKKSILNLDKLLKIVYSDKIIEYKKPIESL